MKIQIKKWQREGEKKTPNQKGTSDSSHVPTSDPCRFRTLVTVQKEKKKGAKQKNTKTAAFTAALLSPRHGEVPPVHVQCSFSLAMALASGVQTINCTWQEVKLYIYIYIKKQKTSSSVKTVIILRLTKKKENIWIIILLLFCYHTESAISHQQWFQLTVPIAAQCHNTI